MKGCTALLMLGALLAAGQAGAAAPRGSSAPQQVEDEPAAVAVEPAVWTRRLLGRFKVEGVIHHQEVIDFNRFDDSPPDPDDSADDGIEVRGAYMYLPESTQPVEGKVDCIDFAAGPGLQCVINVVWPEVWRVTGKAQLGGVSDLTPAMTLAGFMPSTVPGGIKVLLVDKRGLGHPGDLVLKGDVASARPACVNLPGMQGCDQRFTISTKADATTVQVNLSTSIRFSRSKRDRKLFLKNLPDPDSRELPLRPEPEGSPNARREKGSEWVTETLDLAFALRLEPPGAASAPSTPPPSQALR